MTIAVTENIRSLNDVETKLGLRRSDDPDFFVEWRGDFAELVDTEKLCLLSCNNRNTIFLMIFHFLSDHPMNSIPCFKS